MYLLKNLLKFALNNYSLSCYTLLVLGVIAEGCCDALRQGLAEILPRLLASIQDPEYYVRECACFALGEQFNMKPSNLLQFHARTLSFLRHIF